MCGIRISRTQGSFIEAIRILDTLKETHDTRKVRSEFEGTVKSHPRSRQDGTAQDVLAELKEFESALDAQADLAMRRIMRINFVVFLVAIGAGNMSTIIDPRAGVATTAGLYLCSTLERRMRHVLFDSDSDSFELHTRPMDPPAAGDKSIEGASHGQC